MTGRALTLFAAALTAGLALAGCAPLQRHGRNPAVAGPTEGVEHVRQVIVQDGRRAVVETWDERPPSGCWRSRRDVRALPGSEVDTTVSIVVGGAGRRPQRVTLENGNPVPGADDAACAPPAAVSELALWRSIAVAGGLSVRGHRPGADGRDLVVLEGPPDTALTGLATLSAARRQAQVTVSPAGAVMRYVFDPSDGRPVEVSTPAAVVRPRDGEDAVTAPAMTIRFTIAEELPAAAAAAVFAVPAAP